MRKKQNKRMRAAMLRIKIWPKNNSIEGVVINRHYHDDSETDDVDDLKK